MIVHLDGLVLDLPPQEIAYAVAPLFSAMASAFGQPRPIRILDACTHPPERHHPMTTHTIDEALERFELVHGAGNWDNNQACVATLLAWTMGYEFSDHLECAHPILNTLAIKANDHPDTTHDGRARIVRAGADGLLDTWWVPTLVIVRAMADVDQDLDPVERAVQILDSVAWWKSTRTRVDADLRSADLSSADLSSAYLSSADLSYANLSYANLSSANLSSANLRSADLSSADLSSANLSSAYLRSANLSSANLSSADLRYANLSSANLSSANLSSAYLSYADLSSANLSSANLRYASGNAWTVLPDGWKVNDAGLIVPEG